MTTHPPQPHPTDRRKRAHREPEPFTPRVRRILLATVLIFLITIGFFMKCNYEIESANRSQAEWSLRQQAWKGSK